MDGGETTEIILGDLPEDVVAPGGTPQEDDLRGENVRLQQELDMWRERVKHVENYMGVQTKRSRQIVAACKHKVKEVKEKQQRVRQLFDRQLRELVSQLMYLQGRLKKEQRRISEDLAERDSELEEKDQIIAHLQEALEASTAPKIVTKDIKKSPVKTINIPAIEVTADSDNFTGSENSSPTSSLQRKLRKHRKGSGGSKTNSNQNLRVKVLSRSLESVAHGEQPALPVDDLDLEPEPRARAKSFTVPRPRGPSFDEDVLLYTDEGKNKLDSQGIELPRTSASNSPIVHRKKKVTPPYLPPRAQPTPGKIVVVRKTTDIRHEKSRSDDLADPAKRKRENVRSKPVIPNLVLSEPLDEIPDLSQTLPTVLSPLKVPTSDEEDSRPADTRLRPGCQDDSAYFGLLSPPDEQRQRSGSFDPHRSAASRAKERVRRVREKKGEKANFPPVARNGSNASSSGYSSGFSSFRSNSRNPSDLGLEGMDAMGSVTQMEKLFSNPKLWNFDDSSPNKYSSLERSLKAENKKPIESAFTKSLPVGTSQGEFQPHFFQNVDKSVSDPSMLPMLPFAPHSDFDVVTSSPKLDANANSRKQAFFPSGGKQIVSPPPPLPQRMGSHPPLTPDPVRHREPENHSNSFFRNRSSSHSVDTFVFPRSAAPPTPTPSVDSYTSSTTPTSDHTVTPSSTPTFDTQPDNLAQHEPPPQLRVQKSDPTFNRNSTRRSSMPVPGPPPSSPYSPKEPPVPLNSPYAPKDPPLPETSLYVPQNAPLPQTLAYPPVIAPLYASKEASQPNLHRRSASDLAPQTPPRSPLPPGGPRRNRGDSRPPRPPPVTYHTSGGVSASVAHRKQRETVPSARNPPHVEVEMREKKNYADNVREKAKSWSQPEANLSKVEISPTPSHV